MKTTTLNIEETTLERVDGLAKRLNRPRSWVINQAIDRFLDYEEWFAKEVHEGLNEVKRDDLASRDEVAETFRKWGIDAP
ncbi:CopG family ribbon-helix-helix protein [Desulfoluna sp.]|uniref:CopG family ribbon-helix-helix protein n=1 Tax=Desulfoluna sp. TaxID=2045199 RepID=UPI002609CB77|nr:ribbon-helix-helix domain-containing protein [Desulfoluna sp.]